MTNTTLRSEREQKVIDRVESELLSGRTFTLIEQAHKSVPLGGPPATSRAYGRIIEALGRFARQGDWHTAAVRGAITCLNPYLTPNEQIAQVAGALAKFVREGYYDVISATGPEASRPSAHQHAVTLRQALLLKMLTVEVEEAADFAGSVPGVGWCVTALMEREGMTLPSHLFPLHAAVLASRSERA
jgi:hypothetical protein